MTAKAYLARTSQQEAQVQSVNGDASWSFPFDLPSARNAAAPTISVDLSSRRGNDLCGYGAGLNAVGRVLRRDRIDQPWSARPLVLEGVGELVAVASGKWRPMESALRCMVVGSVNGALCVMYPDGRRDTYGESAGGRDTIIEDGAEVVVEWRLERRELPDADAVRYAYVTPVGGVALLSVVNFGPYSLSFAYEARPDPVTRTYAGQVRALNDRLSAVRLTHNPGVGEPTAIRRWELSYSAHVAAGWSVLRAIRVEGADGDATPDRFPAVKFDVVDATVADATVSELRLPEAPARPSQGRVGTLSWFANGRPSLFEADDASLRVISDEVLGSSIRVTHVPQEFFSYPGRTGFSDVTGDGLSDLLLVGDGVAGQFRSLGQGGFGDFEEWDLEIPAGLLFGRNAALCDVDGDGRNEVVCFDPVANEWLAIQPARSGTDAKRLTLTGNLPEQVLDGRLLHLTDFTGDGLADFVLIDGESVHVWLNLGGRSFSGPHAIHIEQSGPLALSPRIGFADFSGDGASDLYALEGSGIHVWMNRAGRQFAYLGWFELPGLSSSEDMILCDWHGIGRMGVVWWGAEGPPRFLSPLGLGAIGSLLRLDNGMGISQVFRWSTTAKESAAARRAGRPWSSELPFPLLICSQVETADVVNGASRTMQYEYASPYYWIQKRRFLGFRRSEVRQLDASGQPMRSTETLYETPLGPEPSLAEVVLSGSLKDVRLHSHDGGTFPWIRVANRSTAWGFHDAAGQMVAASALLQESVTEHLSSEGEAYAVTTVGYDDVDARGRPRRIVETASTAASSIFLDGRRLEAASSEHRLETRISFADDPAGRFADRPSAIRQMEGDGTVLSATLYYYDEEPGGSVGANGRLTSALSMVLSDAQASPLGSADELMALGYIRVEGEEGWWRKDREVEESVDVQGRRVTILRDALGHHVKSTYDHSGIWVEKSETPTGTRSFVPDPYANKPAVETDEFGIARRYTYDGLGRLRKVGESGQARPVRQIDPEFSEAGIVLHIQELADEVTGTYTLAQEILDAQGHRLETVRRDTASARAFSSGACRYNLDGKLVSRTVPYSLGPETEEASSESLPQWVYEYDGLNRVTSVSEPGGARRSLSYVGPWVIESDPLRPWQPRRALLTDARGQLVMAASGDGSALTRMDRDARGNPRRVLDMFGRQSVFEYDLLGRQIRSETPDGGTQSTLLDALGAVRRSWRNGVVSQSASADVQGRLSQTQTGDRTACAFAYNSSSAAAGAGLLREVVAPAGSTQLTYDRGDRIATRTYKRRDAANEYRLKYDYRADGKLRSLTLPQGANLRWNYDEFGRIASIPNFVRSAEYDTDGTLKALVFQNGVRTELQREADRNRLRGCSVASGATELLRSGVFRTGGQSVAQWQDGVLRKNVLTDALQRMVALRLGDDVLEAREYDSRQLLIKIGELALTYDADLRLVRAGDDTLATNARGAVTQWGARQFRFDGKDVVASIASPTGTRSYDVDHQGNVCAAYDGDGALVFYQPDPHLVETAVGIFAFIHFGSLPIARVRLQPDGSMTDLVFLHYDVFGRLAIATDAAANVVKEVQFEAGGAPKATIGVIDEALDMLFEGNRYAPVGECYLQGARLYAPRLGRFLSADVIAYDAADPMGGERYLFARGNPLQRGDPSGLFLDDFWREVSRAWNDWGKKVVMAIAVIVIAIYASPAIIAGMAVGALVGGLAAHAKGGDVIEGMLFGALLGAAGAWGAGAAAAAIPTGGGILGAAAAGALQGAITGAAMGLAAGYAGGAGSAEDMLQGAARGMLTGAVAGAVMGAGGEWLKHAKTESVNFEAQRAKFVKVLGEGLNGKDNVGSAFGKAAWEFAQPYVKNGAIELGKYIFAAGAWGTTAQVVSAAAAGYQAGGFGKPLETVIWEDVLGQRVEGEVFGAKF